MKLYIKDRIYLLNILPQKVISYKTFSIKKELINKISISEEDKEKYKIETGDDENKTVKWDYKYDQENPLELSLTEDLANYLKTACESVSENEYTDDIWNLIERIFDECALILP